MKQVFYRADGTKTVIDAIDIVKNVVAEVAKIDIIDPIVNEVTHSARLATCGACDKFAPDTKQCMKCGCFMQAKSKIRTAKCPLDKWAE